MKQRKQTRTKVSAYKLEDELATKNRRMLSTGVSDDTLIHALAWPGQTRCGQRAEGWHFGIEDDVICQQCALDTKIDQD